MTKRSHPLTGGDDMLRLTYQECLQTYPWGKLFWRDWLDRALYMWRWSYWRRVGIEHRWVDPIDGTKDHFGYRCSIVDDDNQWLWGAPTRAECLPWIKAFGWRAQWGSVPYEPEPKIPNNPGLHRKVNTWNLLTAPSTPAISAPSLGSDEPAS